jgi:hypothetical protein
MEEVLALLRRNDPSETEIDLHSRDFTDAAKLSAALLSNTFVNSIWLDLEGLWIENNNWDSLLRVLATHENFERVTLIDEDDFDERNPPDRVAPFLLAIQQNPRVQTVHLEYLKLYGDSMASFLGSATSITTLHMCRCGIEAPGGALAVAAALQRNKHIQRLELRYLDEIYLIPILNNLGSNTSVKELSLWFFGQSLNSSLALQNSLESTKTIRQFEFHGIHVDMNQFRPIAQGLTQSTSVTDVKLYNCYFNTQEKALLLTGVLESKSNLQSLALHNCSVLEDGQESFSAAIFKLLQPHSLLHNLELRHLSCYGFDSSPQFARLLTATETSPLERFSIGTIASSENCAALIASIPKMQVGTLEFDIHRNLQHMKVALLQAVRRNASLRSVVGVLFDDDDLFDDDKEKLNSYSARNEFLAHWIENPTSVSKAACSEFLAAAQTTGPDIVFRILLELAPALGLFESVQGRKRRRPIFYLPY